MKKIYESPESVKMDLQIESGILNSSVPVSEEERSGDDAWTQVKHPIWGE